jgi:hypothetical protein
LHSGSALACGASSLSSILSTRPIKNYLMSKEVRLEFLKRDLRQKEREKAKV